MSRTDERPCQLSEDAESVRCMMVLVLPTRGRSEHPSLVHPEGQPVRRNVHAGTLGINGHIGYGDHTVALEHSRGRVPNWAREKLKHVDQGPLDFMGGHEFENLRSDWDRAWWQLVMDTAVDIPSRGGPTTVPFEQWRSYMDASQTDRSQTILAVDGLEPVGVISLSRSPHGKMNINYTGVASNHRRKGLSTALKIKAMILAKTLGARTLVTQNHQDNPMLALNQRLGFVRFDAMTEYVLGLGMSME